jgi:hypothetical protein
LALLGLGALRHATPIAHREARRKEFGMNVKRLAIVIVGGLLLAVLVPALFSLAEPDSSYMRDVSTGETQVIYDSEADRETAEQLATWATLTQGLVLLVVAGLVVHGTRPGKWLRAPSTELPISPPGGTR